MKQDARHRYVLRPRWRVLSGRDIVLGPGKADLLQAIEKSHSLRQAATELGMSYMRAWKLVQMMNTGFREPLVMTQRGGARHGLARLTPAGRQVLALYRQLETRSLAGAGTAWRQLQHFLPADRNT